MSIHVLFFGQLADIAQDEFGTTSITIDETQSSNSLKTIAEIALHLAALSPTLGAEIKKTSNLYALNQSICKDHCEVTTGDEVAFMSPLSGG